MNLVLGKEHLGKIVRLDVVTVVTLPEKVFKEGDLIVIFNNTDSRTMIESKLEQTYRSGMAKPKMFLEIPPRSLVNLVFVADEAVVLTVGL